MYDSPFAAYPLLRSRFGPDAGVSVSCLVTGLQLPELIGASHASASALTTPSVPSLSPTSFTPHPISSHSSSSPIPFPDLKPLKQAVLHRTLGQLTARNADLRVCQYEVPGGGVCRDTDCDELHLSQIASEPSGTSWHCSFFKLTDAFLRSLGSTASPIAMLLSLPLADTELAAFVHGTLPHPWSGRCDVRAIEIALEGVQLRGGAKDVDTRVREALAGLGIPIA